MGQDRQAALRTNDREELIFLLHEASELEHGLCCCYLFAAFSLKRGLDEGLTVWAVFDERFTQLVEYSAKLVAADSKGVGLDRVHETLEGLAAGLRKHRRNAIAPPSPHR